MRPAKTQISLGIQYDDINLPGYVFLSQCRKQKYIRKSGGIGVFVKQSLPSYVSFVEYHSDYVLWLMPDEDIYAGAIYIPPYDSRFYNSDEIVEITNIYVSNKYVLLMGDFNARPHNKQDFLDEDEFFRHQFDYDKDLIDHF